MSMSKDRAFESLLLENYSSFILIECIEEFTLQGALSGHNQGKIDKKKNSGKIYVFFSYVGSEFHFQKETFTVNRETRISVRLQFMIFL